MQLGAIVLRPFEGMPALLISGESSDVVVRHTTIEGFTSGGVVLSSGSLALLARALLAARVHSWPAGSSPMTFKCAHVCISGARIMHPALARPMHYPCLGLTQA